MLCLLDTYKGLVAVSIKNGTTCNFWHDLWDNVIPNFDILRAFFSFVKKDSMTFQQVVTATDHPHTLFRLPLLSSGPNYKTF